MTGEGPLPPELLPVLICKTFPQYTLEGLADMGDIAPLLRGAVLWNYYQTIAHADMQNPPKLVAELIQYERYLQLGLSDAQATEVLALTAAGEHERAQERLDQLMGKKKAGQ